MALGLCVCQRSHVGAEVIKQHAQAMDDPDKVIHVFWLAGAQVSKVHPLRKRLTAHLVGVEERMHPACHYHGLMHTNHVLTHLLALVRAAGRGLFGPKAARSSGNRLPIY